MEEQEIIEVEAVDKFVHEAKPSKKPKKAKYQYGRRIALFTKIDWFCLRFFFPFFMLGVIGTWAFWMCFDQHQDSAFCMVMLILSLVVLCLAILLFASHFLWKALIKRWMSKDPNFQE